MNKVTKWGVITLIAVGVGGAIYLQRRSTMGMDQMEEPPVQSSKTTTKSLNINAIIMKPQVIVDLFNTTGVLHPDEMVDLSFESSGKIVNICFEEGTTVKKGDLLANVNCSQLLAEKQRLTAQLKLAKDRVYRQSTLLKRDAVSQEALEQVQTALATLQADIDIIDAKIELTKLHAPFDGTIGLRQVSMGSYVTPTTVVAKLTKMSPLKVEFSVPERYAQTIEAGTNLEFRVEGELETFKASVYATESTVDPELHQYTVRAIYPNKRGHLMPGRYAAVTLHKEEIRDALAVPSESIVPEMGKDKVYLYRSGKATPVEIVTGLRTENQVQVVHGLSVGDTLIVSGTLQLRMGLDVTLDQVD